MYKYKRITPEEALALDALGVKVYPMTPPHDLPTIESHFRLGWCTPADPYNSEWWVSVED